MGIISSAVNWATSTASNIISKAAPALKFLQKWAPWISYISMGIQVISWLRKPDTPDIPNMDGQAEQNAKGVLINKTSSNAPLPIIYGKRKVGGVAVFLETSGTDNTYLYMIMALCEGGIESCEKIYIDDKEVTWSGALTDGTERTVDSSDSNFYKADPTVDGSSAESTISATWYDGDDDQTYNTTVGALSSWTSSHRLRGISYLALKFKWNQDCFGGIPNIKAEIKGRKVYDPNLDTTKTGGSGSHREDTASTWEWSDNPVLCTLDYMRNARFGMGIANSFFDGDYADWQTAADVCDVDVTPYTAASAIDLLDMGAVIDTKKKCIENLKTMVTGFRGYLNYANGEYKVLSESTGSAAISLTEDNIIGGIQVSSLDRNSRFNRVICTFVNPDKNYQADEVQWPPVDDSGLTSADQHATMKTADGGFLQEGRFDFPTITNVYQAQGLAEVICRRSRNNLNVALRCDATGLDLMVGEIVNITHATPAFSAKTFRVQGMQVNTDLTTELQLTEYQAAFYTWATQTQAATIPDTTLPNPYSVVAPASVTLTDELIEYSDGVVLTRLNILVGASTDKFRQYYQVETKKTSESDYKVLTKGVSAVLNYEQLNVVDGVEYSVRVKCINSLGVSSAYITGTRTIVGATETPSDVSGLSVSMVGSNQMQLSWPSVTDLDVSYYAIRYQNVSSGASWASSTNLTQVVRRKSNSVTINARIGAFLIKAVDKLGNESDNETIVYTNISGLEHYSAPISTINEETISAITGQSWEGTFDGDCVKGQDSDNNFIATLDTILLWDSAVGNIDSASGLIDTGPTDATANPTYYLANIKSSGEYIGGNTISLDAVYDATFQATIDMIANDLYDLFDSGRGASVFDNAPGPFDGSSGSQCDAILQVGASESSLGAISTYNDISQQATVKGRYFKFKLKLSSGDNKARPEVSKMQIILVLEKRFESGEDVVSGAGAKAIVYTNAFYASPAVGIAAQNMVTGDYYTITSKTKTGFTITFYNSSAAAQDRTFDYVAKGYGLKS
jgi:predicted phage tail protein